MVFPGIRSRCVAAHLAVWLALVLFGAGSAGAASVTATLNRPVITLGESVTLTINVAGGQAQQPVLPAMQNIQVVGSGTSFQVINGAFQQAFTYELAPAQAGDLIIPAIAVQIGAQVAATQPVALKVLPPGAAAGGAPPVALAKIVLPKTNLFVGEVLDLEIQLYMQEGRLTQYPQLPADSGFTIGKWLKPTESRAALNNVAYSLVTFKTPITAVKAGALTVGPATQPIIVPDRSKPPGFFFRNEREMRVMSEPVTAIALPLPSNNVPATFAGAVGQYAVNWSAAPTSISVGDPVTVRLQVSGRGWLDALKLPSQPQWRDFKMYEPNAKVEGADPNNVGGTKTFEFVVVPQSADIKSLPALAFTYFDPQAAAYRTVTAPAIPLSVKAATAPAVALPRLTATNTAEAAPMSDIAHIKLRPGVAAARAPVITQPWFLALQLAAPAVWLGLLLRRKRAAALENNPRLRRKREVAASVAEALKRMKEQAAANQSDQFFATAVRALQEQIGERLDIPTGSVTESVVAERLRPSGLPDPTCRALEEIFHAANLARYAPVKSTAELNQQLQRVEQAIRELQAWEVKS